MMSEKISIIVSVSKNNGRNVVEVGFPKNQELLDVKDTSHILAGAISLLIKSSSKGDKIKDYELITEIIEHLNMEFINIDSYSDLYVNKSII